MGWVTFNQYLMMLNKGVQLPCQLQHQQLLPWPHWLCLLYQVRKPDVSFTCFLSTLLFRQVYQLCFSDRFTNFDITLFKGTDYHFFKFNHRLLPKMRLMYIWENTLPYFQRAKMNIFCQNWERTKAWFLKKKTAL